MSKWATTYIEQLNQGNTVRFRPRGNSMSPKIKSGDLVTVSPITEDLRLNDIVLCEVNHNQYLHVIRQIDKQRGYLIGNNHGRMNGWTRKIYGILKTIG